ncbi:MAG: cytochrome c family protein [Alphaproteobacteria bacterium]|nr:cytochrome c family protein [Alphaproteobacteria bacterium]MDX5415357.1 cytochrome c family protein [Alphaproteobacteria bacterium]MDX5492572.1 cytochrome c family protein [Alphaproteobacteria bacterium]
MDSFEFNKIAGAVLGSILFIMTIGILAGMFYHTEEANPQAYAVAEAEAGGESGGAAVVEEVPFATLLAQADAGRGERASRKCTACHTFEEGGPARIGPNLYAIVGAPHAHMAGFAYSAAMQAKSSEPWSFEELDHFIENPRGYLPGTIMSFAGIRDAQERADLIVYLNTLGSNKPLPEAPAAPAEEAPANGGEEAPAGENAAE